MFSHQSLSLLPVRAHGRLIWTKLIVMIVTVFEWFNWFSALYVYDCIRIETRSGTHSHHSITFIRFIVKILLVVTFTCHDAWSSLCWRRTVKWSFNGPGLYVGSLSCSEQLLEAQTSEKAGGVRVINTS